MHSPRPLTGVCCDHPRFPLLALALTYPQHPVVVMLKRNVRPQTGEMSSFDHVSIPQDDYALNLLTHAAMQTQTQGQTQGQPNHSSPGQSAHPGHAGHKARADMRSSTATSSPITNRQHHHQHQRPYQHQTSGISKQLSRDLSGRQHDIITSSGPPRTTDVLSSYSVVPIPIPIPSPTTSSTPSSARNNLTINMSTQLAYTKNGVQNQWSPAGAYHHQSLSNGSYSNLGILNAESYDDGRLSTTAASAQEARDVRLRQEANGIPFGVTELERDSRGESEEFEKGPKKRRNGKHKLDDLATEEEEDARKKARGRPRVDTKDETAADVSSDLWLSLRQEREIPRFRTRHVNIR